MNINSIYQFYGDVICGNLQLLPSLLTLLIRGMPPNEYWILMQCFLDII